MIIGDEILSGRTLDSNVNTIAKFLSALGIDLNEVRMVRDVEMTHAKREIDRIDVFES